MNRVALFGMGVFWSATLAAQNMQTFTAGVESVLVNVSVLNGNNPVRALAAKDFVLTDNKVIQQVDGASADATPIDASLVVDMSFRAQLRALGVAAAGSAALQTDVRKIAQLLRADDRLQVITFASEVREIRPMQAVGAQPQLALENPSAGEFSGAARVTDALLYALTWPPTPGRRHVVVVFSDGSDLHTTVPLDRMMAIVRRADALLQVVLTPPARVPRTHEVFMFRPYERATRDVLSDAARITGGQALLTGDAVGAFKGILDEFRGSYLLRYTVTGIPHGGWHDIAVVVPSCPKCTIHARTGYFGG